MKKFALILLGLLLLPVSAHAQTTVDNAFEERVVRVLQERLNLQSTRDALDAGSSDLSVRTLIEGDPQVALLGNARVVGNRDDGTPSQLAFSVVLVPDSPSLAQREQILEFATQDADPSKFDPMLEPVAAGIRSQAERRCMCRNHE